MKQFALILSAYVFVILIFSVLYFPAEGNPSRVWLRTVDAESELKSGSTYHRAENLFDRSPDSWCEGMNGDGAGARVTVNLAPGSSVQSLHLFNGFGHTKYWEMNNRVKDIIIDGITYRLEDRKGFQQVSLKKRSGDTLTLSIASVYKGSKWQDTCIAEIAFGREPAMNSKPDPDYRSLEGKNWDVDGDMHGNLLTFRRGYLFTVESVPCGDETCPWLSTGSCFPLGEGRYSCKIVQHCHNYYNYEKKEGGKVCKDLDFPFILEIDRGIPYVTYNGERRRLVPYN